MTRSPPFAPALAPRRPGRRGRGWLGWLVGAAAAMGTGCAGDGGPALEVVVQTDYVPGVEFVRVRTTVAGRFYVHDASPGDDFAGARSVARAEDLAPGLASVRVQLQDAAEGVVAERTVTTEVGGLTVVNVSIPRCPPSQECPRRDGGTLDGGSTEGGLADGAPVDGGTPDTGPAPDAGSDAADARICLDEDGDGVTTCEGDCDDTDWLRHPGASEVCGDGVTNDCNAAAPPDDGCDGRGVFVSDTRGFDSNPGTKRAPVQSIGQGIMNAVELGGVAVYVAEGRYEESVVLPAGVSLEGALRDGTFQPGGSASNILAGTSSVPALAISEGTTTDSRVRHFRIYHRSSSTPTNPIHIEADASPVLENLSLNVRDPIRIDENASPVLRDVTCRASCGDVAIEVNPERRASNGSPRVASGLLEGSIRVFDSAIDIVGVTILDERTPAFIELIGTFDARVEGCHVAHGDVGIRVLDGSATLAGNLVEADTGEAGEFQEGTGGDGVGISIEGAIGEVELVNNVVVASAVQTDLEPTRIGLVVAPTSAGPGAFLSVHSNLFVGGRRCVGRSAGVELRGGDLASPIQLGSFLNNVIDAGTCDVRHALAEDSPNLSPALFEHNALHADSVASSSDRALYRRDGTTSLTTIAQVNGLGSGYSGNVEDSCGIAPDPDGVYRLPAGSDCIDAGSSTDAPPTDFEGDPRPQGAAPDIGPDEAG